MTLDQALAVIESSMRLIDAGVQHEGMFSSIVQYKQAKALRSKYKGAVKILRRELHLLTRIEVVEGRDRG